ncbi:Large ribosomal RNA subunit accumulation protein YceD [Methylophilaceae bacterium]|nr:Large ribosomal RNA subunit accumulation protein YceD [Methylophilaceae bacterium]
MAASINQSTVINNIEFAQKALEIHDIIPLLQFSRLGDSLASTSGELDCRLSGGKGVNNIAYLQLQVQGRLQLVCQRCLQPLVHDLSVDVRYVLVRNESEMPAPEDESDDEDYLPVETEMPVLELIEDEVLLALPIAPRHEDGQCASENKIDEYRKPNPFAKLEALKSKK